MIGPTSVFQVEGIVVRDVNQGANFAYITVREGEKQYWDVACFEDGPLDQFRNLRGGACVKVRGHLGKRKVKDAVDASGRPRYEIQLIAERIKALPAVVSQYQQPPLQYAAPSQGLAYAHPPQAPLRGARANYPNPQWPNPEQPNMPTHQQEPAGDHPASFDGDDGVPW